MNVAVPLYAIIDVADANEAARAKAAIENLLKNDMVKMTLASAGVRVRTMTVGDPYPCEMPQPQQPAYPQQPQQAPYGNGNGRR